MDCCSKTCRCLSSSIAFIMFVLSYIIASTIEISVLVVYHEQIEIIKLILIVNSSLIMIFMFITGIKLAIDLFSAGVSNCKCGLINWTFNIQAFCFNITKFKNLHYGFFWLTALFPWLVCNIVSVIVFAQRLININSFWIIIMAASPFLIIFIGMGFGYIIRKKCC